MSLSIWGSSLGWCLRLQWLTPLQGHSPTPLDSSESNFSCRFPIFDFDSTALREVFFRTLARLRWRTCVCCHGFFWDPSRRELAASRYPSSAPSTSPTTSTSCWQVSPIRARYPWLPYHEWSSQEVIIAAIGRAHVGPLPRIPSVSAVDSILWEGGLFLLAVCLLLSSRFLVASHARYSAASLSLKSGKWMVDEEEQHERLRKRRRSRKEKRDGRRGYESGKQEKRARKLGKREKKAGSKQSSGVVLEQWTGSVIPLISSKPVSLRTREVEERERERFWLSECEKQRRPRESTWTVELKRK